MKINTITFKLLLAIMAVFFLSNVGVLLVADGQIHRILNKSKEGEYGERIDTVIGILQQNDERLHRTGLVDVYKADFQDSTVKFVQQNYYQHAGQKIYPFILDSKGTVILHPTHHKGNRNYEEEWRKVAGGSKTRERVSHFVPSGEDNWVIFKQFEPWNWVVGYSVSHDILFADGSNLRNILLIIMTTGTVVALLVAFWAVTRITAPIKELTGAAEHIEQGNLEQEVDVQAKDEIGALAKSFDNMRKAVKKQISDLNREIIERKKAEQANVSTNRMLRLVLDSIPDRVFWKNKKLEYMGCNPPLAKDAGLDTPEAVIGKTDYDFPWAATEAEAYRADDSFVIESGQPKHNMEETQTGTSGETLWVRTSKVPMFDEDGGIIGVLGTYSDITERKQAEVEINKLRNYLVNIIDSMPSIIIGVSADGIITQWNRRAQEVTGCSPQETVGLALSEVPFQLSLDKDWIDFAIQNREEYKILKRKRREGGHTVTEDVTIYPLAGEEVKGVVIRIDDVTDRARLEEMMIQNEKMLSVGGLAAGMAHEINNPLAGMIMSANVMHNRLSKLSGIPANVKAAENAGISLDGIKQYMENRDILRMLSTINDSGKRLAVIVENMLTFARKSESEIVFSKLDEILDKTVELASTDFNLKKNQDFKKIDIQRNYVENLPKIPCEETKIQQVILNILKNGAEAMQTAGVDHPTFRLETVYDQKRQMACMNIEDNGPGMDENVRKRIFEPFYTTKPVGVGTGLGLSVSYFIITEDHKGEMVVDSQPGQYARFTICLPLKRDPSLES